MMTGNPTHFVREDDKIDDHPLKEKNKYGGPGGMFLNYSDTKTQTCEKTLTLMKQGCKHVHTEACYAYELCLTDPKCWDWPGHMYGWGVPKERRKWESIDYNPVKPQKNQTEEQLIKNQQAHKVLICGLEEGEYVCGFDGSTERKLICGKTEGQIENYDLGCGLNENTIIGWKLSCTEPALNDVTIEGKLLTCDKSNTIEDTQNKTLANPVITDGYGYYEFDGLDSMKKYYVKFVYNGMLYTNVLYNSNNAIIVSKADETSRYDYRTPFNEKFKEIGSYPENYKIINKVFGEELGDYNKTYLQEDIVEIFKKISEKMVRTGTDNYIGACRNTYNELKNNYAGKLNFDEELKRMIQFAADCRIQSQTVQNYPLTDKFTISAEGKSIGNVFYAPIYSGKYDQLHVNLGIKARPSFDMHLEKGVRKVEVSINGQDGTFNYNPDANLFIPKVAIQESDYINGMRQAYLTGNTFDYKITYNNPRDNLNMYVRPEDITNGKLDNRTDGSIAQYDKLEDEDKLKVLVTYRIQLLNEGSVSGAVTEIVDYYDTNFTFIEAYLGDQLGTEKLGKVDTSNTSKYIRTEKKATKNGYETIYLQPKEEMLVPSDAEYIYVTFELTNPSELLTRELMTNNTEQLSTMNLAEINDYKTKEGQIDIDSIPGNFDIRYIDNLNNIEDYQKNHPESYEDDACYAPALVFKRHDSRTIEGTVFEDGTGELKQKDGKLNQGETGIAGAIVELIEVKNNEMYVRATTTTNQNGWYRFTGFIPGDYVIRYTYGADNNTALTSDTKGLNAKSYNGQDYQATTYTVKGSVQTINPKTDDRLIERYRNNNERKNTEESNVVTPDNMALEKHNSYWYTDANAASDAKDYKDRTDQIKEYARNEYGKEIVNHKAEVFNAYVNPQPSHITKENWEGLVNELERRTYGYAYTPVMKVEVEYATKVTEGNIKHEHKILGVDFGLVERPKEELTLDQDVKHIKVTLSDGNVLFDTENQIDNLQWIKKGKIEEYDKNELINIIMDEELINGATLEITYNLTVTNNSEQGTGTTRAKNIINYVANNLNFDEKDNLLDGKSLWKVVSKDDVQNDQHSSFVNKDVVDLSTQSIILQATEGNPLTKTELEPGGQVSTTLKLKKVLSAESSVDDLTYTNMAEIVEIENEVGRYDHEATPGNQKLEEQPREHDTAGASKNVETDYEPDGKIIVTPPTGSTYIYYVIGITASLILAVGIFLIKKFVIDKNK